MRHGVKVGDGPKFFTIAQETRRIAHLFVMARNIVAHNGLELQYEGDFRKMCNEMSFVKAPEYILGMLSQMREQYL